MSTKPRGVEWKVGLFMLIGILTISVMAIKFGKVGQGFKKFYMLAVEFPNASGLLKDAKVYLSGSNIGSVEGSPEKPKIVDGKFVVRVNLRVDEDTKIPRGSSFTIASSGFLGDSYVAINPPNDPNLSDVYNSGETIVGSRTPGLGDLTESGGEVMEELKKRLVELQPAIQRIDKIISEENEKNIKEAISNLKVTSENLKNSSTGFDGLVKDGKETMASVKNASVKLESVFKKADEVMVKIDGAVVEIRTTAEKFGKTSDSVKDLMAKVANGKGALGMLIADPETAANLKALINNLRTRGVLFYKDKDSKKDASNNQKRD